MKESKGKKFTKKQLEFIDYLVGNGNGSNKKEVAQDIGVSVKTINVWLKNDRILNEIYNQAMLKISKELPKVLDALIKNAKSGNIQAIKLILEHVKKKKSSIKSESLSSSNPGEHQI